MPELFGCVLLPREQHRRESHGKLPSSTERARWSCPVEMERSDDYQLEYSQRDRAERAQPRGRRGQHAYPGESFARGGAETVGYPVHSLAAVAAASCCGSTLLSEGRPPTHREVSTVAPSLEPTGCSLSSLLIEQPERRRAWFAAPHESGTGTSLHFAAVRKLVATEAQQTLVKPAQSNSIFEHMPLLPCLTKSSTPGSRRHRPKPG
jgi:hypothetical protein